MVLFILCVHRFIYMYSLNVCNHLSFTTTAVPIVSCVKVFSPAETLTEQKPSPQLQYVVYTRIPTRLCGGFSGTSLEFFKLALTL